MKTKWPKLPHFFVPLFECANIYLCRTREEWAQACSSLDVHPGNVEMLAGSTATFRSIENGEVLYLLGVFNASTATLVHECAHLAFYVCRDVGVTISTEDANETYCYVLDKIFAHFQPYLKE